MFRLPDSHIIINKKFYNEVYANCKGGQPFAYLFTGPAGTGKTELMKIIANYLMVIKPKSVSDLWTDYFRILCSSVTDKNEALERRVDVFKDRELFLDDLGAEANISDKAVGFTGAGLTAMCDRIVADRQKGGYIVAKYANIITTNLTGNEIQAVYGERVYDRMLQAFTVVRFVKILKNKKGKLISFREKQTEVVEL